MSKHFGKRFYRKSVFQTDSHGERVPDHMKCHLFSDMADVGKLFKVGVAFLVRDGREQVFRLAFPDVEADHFPGLGKKGNECGVVGLSPVKMDVQAIVGI